MGKIVLSYRRDDAKTITNWLHEKLVDRYGRDAIFRDIDSIQPTENFKKRIGRALRECEFVVAVIGPSWLGPSREGPARIHATNDWVRIEIETALQLDLPLLPILVEDARMPEAESLPASLREITEINALPLASGGARFHEDLDRLFAAIDKVIAFVPERAELSKTTPQPSSRPAAHNQQTVTPTRHGSSMLPPESTAPPSASSNPEPPPRHGDGAAEPGERESSIGRADAHATGLREAVLKQESDRPKGVDALFKWPFAGFYLLLPTAIAGAWYLLAARVMGGGVGPPLAGFACIMFCLGIIMKRQGLGSPAAAMAGAVVSVGAGLVAATVSGLAVALLVAVLVAIPVTLIAWAITSAPTSASQ